MKKDKKSVLLKINGALTTQVLYVGVKLGLFDCDEILQKADARLLRALSALELIAFQEGRWKVTEEGRFLSKEHPESMRDLILYKAAPFNWAAYGKLAEALQSGKNAFETALGTPLFDYLQDHPEEMALFQNGMAYFERSGSKAVLDQIDLKGYASICDLGCGTGGFLKRLLEKWPHLKGLGVDLPSVVALADKSVPLEGLDFFETVPEGFDLYLLRNILHDWSDEACIALLKKLPKGSHALVFEALVPENNETRLAAFSDLHLFATTSGGGERTLAQYRKIFESAGFTIESVLNSSAAKSVIKIVNTI
ncbi:MAG: hypothetical protein KDK48_05195 [Chlamydiia bacterium]|nr:hypothetical protein [Chlamydiia bacterium]